MAQALTGKTEGGPMKATFFYPFIALAVVVLAVAAVGLTQVLLGLSVPDTLPEAPVLAQTDSPIQAALVDNQRPAVAETIIEAPPTAAESAPLTPAPGLAALTPSAAPAPAIDPAPSVEAMGGVIASDAPPPVDPAETGVGKVALIRGKASATNRSGRRRNLVADSRLFLEEMIETGQNTRLEILLDDGTKIFHGDNSVVVLDKYLCNEAAPKDTGFAMRLVNGMCRVITGKIVEINPERFKVRTRMATMGIRGCDLGFRSSPDKDEIYIIELSGQKRILVDTTTRGAQLVNINTGVPFNVNASEKKSFEVQEPRTVVTVIRGEGSTVRPAGIEEIRGILSDTSHLPATQIDVVPGPTGATVILEASGTKGEND